MRAGIDIKVMFDMRDHHISGFGVDQGSIGPPGEQGVLAHPEEIRLELISGLNWMGSGSNDVTSAGIDLIFKNQGDRLACGRFCIWITPNDDFFNTARYP